MIFFLILMVFILFDFFYKKREGWFGRSSKIRPSSKKSKRKKYKKFKKFSFFKKKPSHSKLGKKSKQSSFFQKNPSHSKLEFSYFKKPIRNENEPVANTMGMECSVKKGCNGASWVAGTHGTPEIIS